MMLSNNFYADANARVCTTTVDEISQVLRCSPDGTTFTAINDDDEGCSFVSGVTSRYDYFAIVGQLFHVKALGGLSLVYMQPSYTDDANEPAYFIIK